MLPEQQPAPDIGGSHRPRPGVILCVPTYRRPQGLATLLQHVARINYAGRLSVVVVDNDDTRRDGVAVVQAMSAGFPFLLHCEVESTRGQTYAYNRCFALACGAPERPDYIAVLDDDE